MGQDIDFRVEDAALQRALLAYARQSGKEWSAIIVQEARLLAVSLAYQTQPKGDGSDAKLAGEKAVSRDLAKLYADAPRAYMELRQKDEREAAAFYKAMLQNDLKAARSILEHSSSRWRNVEIGPFKESYHKNNRNGRGRVQNRHVPAQIVSGNGKKLDAHRKKKIRMVGFAKGGWASAARSLTGNTRGIPQFVTRHKSAPGHATNQSQAALNPHVSLHNDVRYIRTACPPSQQAWALRYSTGRMLKMIEKAATASARRTMTTVATVS